MSEFGREANVAIKIGGYTDNTGDVQSNLGLSKQRAQNVMNRLIDLGIDANRMDAEGYGQEYPVADNNSDLGKAMNRRIDVKVTAK